MKIRKTPFTTEIEFTTDELRDLEYKIPPKMAAGLFMFLREKFGLNLYPVGEKRK